MVSELLIAGEQAKGETGTQIQPFRECDLVDAGRLLMRTANLARKSAGMAPLPAPVTGLRRPLPIMNYLFFQDPELSWGAYDGRKLVGFLVSYIRDRQWHVAYLVVDPAHQSLGIGHELMARGFACRRVQEMHFFSHCAFPHGLRAVGLGAQFGLFPRKTLLSMRRACDRDWSLPPRPEAVTMGPITSVETVTELNRMDGEVRGVNRAADHCFWLSQDDCAGYVFSANDRPAGYAYLSRKGMLGPVLAARDVFITDILLHCLHEARQQGQDNIRLWISGKNFTGIQLLLRCGFRFDEVAILLTNRVFCDLRRYLPHSLVLL